MINQFNVKEHMYKSSIILSSIKIDENLYEIIQNTNMYFMQNSLELFNGFGFLSGVTIGDIGVDILIKLGAKEIYLLGVDASIDSKTGKTHVGTHESVRKVNLKNIKNDKVDFQRNIVLVKGNFQEEVPTFLEYTDMIDSLNTITLNNKDAKVFNLGDGAFFENTISIKPSKLEFQIKCIDNKKFKKEFLSNLNKISKKELSYLDKKEIQKEKDILKILNSMDFKSDFLKDFYQLKNSFSDSIIFKIFEKYFKLVLPYANFLVEIPALAATIYSAFKPSNPSFG